VPVWWHHLEDGLVSRHYGTDPNRTPDKNAGYDTAGHRTGDGHTFQVDFADQRIFTLRPWREVNAITGVERSCQICQCSATCARLGWGE